MGTMMTIAWILGAVYCVKNHDEEEGTNMDEYMTEYMTMATDLTKLSGCLTRLYIVDIYQS
jgi:hypothetical protein